MSEFTAEEIEAVRRSVTVVVFNGAPYDLIGSGTLADFVESLQNMLEKIPSEYRSTAEIELDTGYDSYAQFIVSYYEPEPDDAVIARLRERKSEARAKEAEQRQMYAYLKAKYEPRQPL